MARRRGEKSGKYASVRNEGKVVGGERGKSPSCVTAAVWRWLQLAFEIGETRRSRRAGQLANQYSALLMLERCCCDDAAWTCVSSGKKQGSRKECRREESSGECTSKLCDCRSVAMATAGV